MEFIELSQCKTDLDFQPALAWPRPLPLMSYKGQLLVGFDRKCEGQVHRQVIALDESEPLANYIKVLYPNISAIEFLCLTTKMVEAFPEQDVLDLFTVFEFRWRPELMGLASIIKTWPKELQVWARDKRIGFFDLEILATYDWQTNFQNNLKPILDLSPSKSDGMKILEAFVELASMKMIDDFNFVGLNFVQIQKLVNERRFPMRTRQASEMENRSKMLSWPKKTQLRWDFSKDLPELEVRLTAKSSEDLRRLLPQWQAISEQLNQGELNPWN